MQQVGPRRCWRKLQADKECEDTEEMRQWRHLSQEGIHVLWKQLCGKMEDKLEKYKVDEAKKVARNGER